MKICLYTPLPRLANEFCDVLRLFAPLEAFAVAATVPPSAGDAAKAQFTASPVTPDMEWLTHVFTEQGAVWRCAFTLRGQTVERTAPVPRRADTDGAPGGGSANGACATPNVLEADEPVTPGVAVTADTPADITADEADEPADKPDETSAGETADTAADITADEADEPDETTADEPDETTAGEPDETTGELLRRRQIKRLCKLTLYDLCKKLTGFQPPWGSLTGIRPTRLIYERLAQGMSLEASARSLTATFDVAPDKAELLRHIVAVQQTLRAPRPDEADVYVSIPFCRTRCAYCSFPGEALGRGRQVGPYLEALFAEMDAAAALLQARGLTLRALYIGGGTPTALDAEAFGAMLSHTAACFPAAVEFTVEAGRPDTITIEKLRLMQRYGVTRISINPQTMNDQTLRAIGRDHTAAQTEEAFALARSLGFADINMDVIAGLPAETPADFAHTMARIRALAPDSLTVHTLAIKRSSRLHLEGAALPAPEAVADMVCMGGETAAALAMEPYYLYRQKYMAGQQQNVGYARAGAACLYNVDIMEENSTILACGAGAISKRVFQDRDLRIERAPNVSNVAAYTERIAEMIRRKETLLG